MHRTADSGVTRTAAASTPPSAPNILLAVDPTAANTV
jgi:hypothetical protein